MEEEFRENDIARMLQMMKELPSITIPPLHCSFPWHLHPQTPHLRLSIDAWILAHFSHLPLSTNGPGLSFHADCLVSSGFPLLASLLYPSALPSRMEPVAKFIAWVFLFDNLVDDPSEMGADAPAADTLIGSIVSVVEQPSYTLSGNNLPIKAVVETVQEWWYAMRQNMPSRQQARFIAHFKDYLEANRPQITHRSAHTLPDFETYKKIRADAGAWQPCEVLIEYALAIELDEETLNNPLFLELRWAAAYHAYWVNDVCSFKKEVSENDYLNIVPILLCHNMKQQKKDVSLEGVVGEVCAMIKELDENCMRLVAEIKASKLLMSKPGMVEFLEGVCTWVAGNLYWHFVSGRYSNISATDDMYNCLLPATSSS